MKALVVDVVADPAVVGLYTDSGPVSEAAISPRQRLSEHLLPTIDGLLQAAGWQSSEIDRLGMVNEPASFTSLRIAASVLNAVAYAVSAPIVSLTKADLAQPDFTAWLAKQTGQETILPDYGRPPHITPRPRPST